MKAAVQWLLLLMPALQFFLTALAEAAQDRATAPDVGGGNKLRLVHVAALFRHGERASVTTFPGDPNQHYVWPMGRGQLTKRGRQTMWALGKWLRARYARFLTSDVLEVSARSSPLPRCFDSMAILLYGLYPAIDKGRQWKRGQDWQPVAITRPPEGTDKYATTCLPRFIDAMKALYATEAPCSWVGEPSAQQTSSPSKNYPETAAQRCFATAGNLINFVANAANVTDEAGVARYAATSTIVNDLFVNHENGLPLPDWGTKYIRQLSWLNDKFVEFMGRYQKDNMAGALLRDFVASMKRGHAGGDVKVAQAKDDANVEPKLTLYSYQDITIAGAILGINGTLSGRPPYGSAIILEVFARSDASGPAGGKYVRILYKMDDKGVTSIPVEGCTDPCPLEKFEEVLQRKFKPVTRTQCGWSEHQPLV